jgi:hypothetical protein
LLLDHPELAATISRLPLKVFSGKTASELNARAVFFCYRIPRPDSTLVETGSSELRWSDAAGLTVWVCYDLEQKRILTEPGAIACVIRSLPDTPRHCVIEHIALSELRKKVEKQLNMDYLKPLQAPLGVAPILKCWLELN